MKRRLWVAAILMVVLWSGLACTRGLGPVGWYRLRHRIERNFFPVNMIDQELLTRCTSLVVRFPVSVPPEAHLISLRLGVPGVQSPSAVDRRLFAGTMTIREGNMVIDTIMISADTCGPDDLLARKGSPTGCRLVPRRENGDTLALPLRAGRKYELTLNFSKAPPWDAGVWLIWTW